MRAWHLHLPIPTGFQICVSKSTEKVRWVFFVPCAPALPLFPDIVLRSCQYILYVFQRFLQLPDNNNNNHLTQGPPRFLLTRAFYRWAPHPPIRGGSSSSQESPVLPIPSYPALCREDTTSWNHGRPRTHNGLNNHRLPAKHQLLGSIHVLPCNQIMHTRVLHRILANTSFAQPRRDTKATQ